MKLNKIAVNRDIDLGHSRWTELTRVYNILDNATIMNKVVINPYMVRTYMYTHQDGHDKVREGIHNFARPETHA